jgi:hypothetical protein
VRCGKDVGGHGVLRRELCFGGRGGV